MNYAKLIDDEIVFAPNPVLADGNYVGNPPEALLAGLGYKPVTCTEPPEVEEGYIAVPGWEETEETIVQTWTMVEEPDEVDDQRAMEILFGGEI